MYIDDYNLDGLGRFRISRPRIISKAVTAVKKVAAPVRKIAAPIARIQKPFTKIALSPVKIAAAGIRGKSMRKAIETEALQPAGKILHAAAPVLPFIPVVGEAATAVIALDKLRAQKAAAAHDERQAAALEAEIARMEASTPKVSPPITANAKAGFQTAMNNAISDSIAPADKSAAPEEAKPVEAKKAIPWGLLATGALTALSLLR